MREARDMGDLILQHSHLLVYSTSRFWVSLSLQMLNVVLQMGTWSRPYKVPHLASE
jgi:hypothetical protein